MEKFFVPDASFEEQKPIIEKLIGTALLRPYPIEDLKKGFIRPYDLELATVTVSTLNEYRYALELLKNSPQEIEHYLARHNAEGNTADVHKARHDGYMLRFLSDNEGNITVDLDAKIHIPDAFSHEKRRFIAEEITLASGQYDPNKDEYETEE